MPITFKRIFALLIGFLTSMNHRAWQIALSSVWAFVGVLLLFENGLREAGVYMLAGVAFWEMTGFLRRRKSRDENIKIDEENGSAPDDRK